MHHYDSEVVLDPSNSVPAIEVIDVQAEEGRMPVEPSSDQYMNKLVDKVRRGLKPDFDAVNAGIAGVTENVAGLTADVSGITKNVAGLAQDVSGLTTNVASLTMQVEEQAKVSKSRFDHLDQRFSTLDESLDAIKKHLGL